MRTCSLFFAQICLVLSVMLCTTNYALARPLPADAKTGLMTVSKNRSLMIDEKDRRLAAGAQIRTTNNMLVQPQTLFAQLGGRLASFEVPILYSENNQGQIHRIWILTNAELEQFPLDEDPEPVIAPNRSARPSGTVTPNRSARPSN